MENLSDEDKSIGAFGTRPGTHRRKRRYRHSYAESDLSRRMYLLAASLSIEPNLLRHYVASVRGGVVRGRRVVDTDKDSISEEGLLVPTVDVSQQSVCSPLSSEAAPCTGDAIEQNIPSELQAILEALVLPFAKRQSNFRSPTRRKGPSSVPVSTNKLLLRKNRKVSSLHWEVTGGTSTKKNGSHAGSWGWGSFMKSDVRASTASRNPLSCSDHDGLESACYEDRRGDIRSSSATMISTCSSFSSSFSSSCSQGSYVHEEEEISNGAFPLLLGEEGEPQSIDPLPFDTAAEAEMPVPRRRCNNAIEGDNSSNMCHATEKLLEELVRPLLLARENLRPPTISSGDGNANKAAYLGQCMQLLPQELRTTAGVTRLCSLYPPFASLLLEAFVKESAQRCSMSAITRIVVSRLTELVAPVLLSQRMRPRSDDCVDVAKTPEKVTGVPQSETYHTMAIRAQQSLARTILSLVGMLDDSLWTLTLCGILIRLQLVSPTELYPILHRHAHELSKLPQQWTHEVALAYCIVTYEGLKWAALAEEERCNNKKTFKQEESLLSVGKEEGAQRATQDGESEVISQISITQIFIEDTFGRTSGIPNARGGEHREIEEHDLTNVFEMMVSSMKGQNINYTQGEGGGITPPINAPSPSAETALAVPHQPHDVQNSGNSKSNSVATNEVQWNFPEKVPTEVSVPVATVMTCMMLCAGPQSERTVVKLGQWCLRCLIVLRAAPCAVGLTHIMLKYPHILQKAVVHSVFLEQNINYVSALLTATNSFNTSNVGSNEGGNSKGANSKATVSFCEAVLMEGCRLADAALQEQSRVLAAGHLRFVWDNSAQANGAFVGKLHPLLYELQEVQCYLLMVLQALIVLRTASLCNEAQEQLGNLFVTSARLRVATATTGANNTTAPADRGVGDSCEESSLVSSQFVQLVDEVFRTVACAADVFLHFSTGCPRRFCESLGPLSEPQNTLFDELRRSGAWDAHVEYLETVQAAATAYSVSPPSPLISHPSKTNDKGAEASHAATTSSSEPHGEVACDSTHMTPLTVREMIAHTEAVVGDAVSQQDGGEGETPLVAGRLPCSGEPFSFSGAVEECSNGSAAGVGGLTARQKHWWLRRMIVYFMERWWHCRGGVQVVFPLASSLVGYDNLGSNADNLKLLSGVAERSFLQCCAQSF
ncbi:hypothetical protein DPX39_050025100 [Trypanosoma brucei equiperdum]|uniref:Uncharacterized protein n=1 Tax=Trypanosoma brucei equiperdum TaxID=630700 RepID=A0A3L6L7F2_9TRYP|nr:hypothetical protein DPX39_050025100 [Trypanosoma brucei equiperdum]